jgi:hypothetical protein
MKENLFAAGLFLAMAAQNLACADRRLERVPPSPLKKTGNARHGSAPARRTVGL